MRKDLLLCDGKLRLKHTPAAKKRRLKYIENVTRCRDSSSGKQGSDGSIKQLSIQPHPTYLSILKICAVQLCTELFYPTLFPVF